MLLLLLLFWLQIPKFVLMGFVCGQSGGLFKLMLNLFHKMTSERRVLFVWVASQPAAMANNLNVGHYMQTLDRLFSYLTGV